MYQLLVSGSGWNPDHDALDRSRVFEHTTEDLVSRFKLNGTLATAAIMELPAIFASEGTNSDTPLARIGRITKIKQVNREYEFEYTIDRDIPGIPNAKLDSLARELSIDHWQFSRTHWSIKDVDLFEVLLKHSAVSKIGPKLFKITDDPVDDDSVAVMMPFSSEFAPVYQALGKAAKDVRMSCTRADDIWDDEVIIQDVVKLIATARVVVCDLTGKNANVFYEAGIAHTLGKDVILIAQHDSDIPFDLRHIRHIRYLPNAQGLEQLADKVSKRLESLLK
jgi:hypothetical protein